MQTVSVAIIAQDEEEVLPITLECLAGIQDVISEVVIVDGGSVDGTLEVIDPFRERLPIIVLYRPFDSFGVQKNYALDHCTGQWVLGLDADMGLNTLRFREMLLDGRFNCVPVWDFSLVFCKGDMKHFCVKSTTPMPTTRLWMNVGLRYEKEVHEYLVFPGETGWDSVHRTGRIAVCREMCIFETHMLKSEAGLRNRIKRYARWHEKSSSAGIPAPKMDTVDNLLKDRWEGTAPVPQDILDKVPPAAFEYPAAKGLLK